MKVPKILVTGANGQLGNEMRIVAAADDSRYIFADVNVGEEEDTLYLDITDMDAVRKVVADYNVGVVVNCAAYTNVDGAETNYDLAQRLNADAPENLAMAMKEVGGLLVHISTDYVFGKEPYNIPCREEQQGTPTGVYGLTKLNGEKKVMAVGGKYVIIRTAWLYSEFGKNFCKTMMNLTATKDELKVVFDQVGTPTYALDLARVITVIIDDYESSMKLAGEENGKGEVEAVKVTDWVYSKGGIYHYSNEGVCSWFDFARMIAELNGTAGCRIKPCHSNEFPSPVARPSYSVLDKTKIKETFGVEVPYWIDSLRLCIENIKRGENNVSL